MANLKCGLIGCGGRGRHWANYLKKQSDVNMVASCDIDELVLNKFNKKHGISNGYQNLHEMLDKHSDLDFVVICTPHFLHAKQTIAAANKEIHVYCEKPMAISVKECDDMIKACKDNDVKLNIGFQRRYNLNYLYAKKLLDEKKIGDVFHSNVQALWFRTEPYYLNSSPVPENEEEDWEGWRGHWKTEGGSALINQTIHILDWFLLLSGELKDVQANVNISMHEYIECEDNVAATVTFKNGAVGLIQAGTSYKYNSDELRFYGTKGTLNFKRSGISLDGKHLGFWKKLKFYNSVKSVRQNDIMRDFIDAIKKDGVVPVPGEEGRKTIELIRAIYQSVMEERKIKLPLTDNEEHPDLPRLGLENPGK